MSGCEGIENELSALRGEITKLAGRIDSLTNTNALVSRINRLESELQKLSSHANSLHARMQGNERKTSALEQGLAFLNSVFEGIKGRLFSTESSVNTLKASVGTMGSQIAGALGLAGLAASEVKAVKNNIVPLKKQIKDANSLAQSARNIADTASSKAKDALRKGIDAAADAKNAFSRADNAFGRVQKVASEVVENKQGLKALGGKVLGLAAKVLNIISIISSLVTVVQLASILAKVARLDRIVSALESRARRNEQNIADLIKTTSRNYGLLRDEITKQIAKLNPIFERLIQRDNEIYRLLMSEIANLRGEFSSWLSEINNRIDALYGRLISYVNNVVNKVEVRINQQLRENYNDHTSIRNLIQKVQNSFNTQIQNINKQIQNLWNALKNFNPNLALGSLIAAVTAAVLGRILPLLPNLIRSNSPQMTCRFNDTAARQAQQAAQSADRKTTILNTFTQGALYKSVNDGFKGTFTRLGDPIPNGGIAGKLLRFTKSQLWDKAMSVLTFIAVLHNASMLSNAVYLTMTETLNIMVDVIGNTLGLRDEDDKPFDSQQVLGKQFNQVMSDLLGATRWTEIKQTMQAANRTYQAAANAVYTMRSMTDSTLAITQWTAENLAKIGNGLKADGLVSANAYGWMPTVVTPQSAIFNRLQNLDDAASSLNMVASEVQSIQLEAAELAKQKEEFGKEVNKSQKQMEELADAWDNSSKSPDIPRDLLPSKDGD
jgi:hypothetical protein